MRRLGAVLASVLAFSGACAGHRAETSRVGKEIPSEEVSGSGGIPSQRIFRFRFQQKGAAIGFRLVARFAAEGRYRLQASDPVGRTLWVLDYDDPQVRIFDYRSSRSCRSEGPVVFPELGLGPLTPRDVRAILVGEFSAAARSDGGEGMLPDEGDAERRRWTVERSESGGESWTLWKANRPLLWLRVEEHSGALSHRDGFQLQWRETRREPMRSPLESMGRPDGFDAVDCSELGSGGDEG